MNTHNHSHDDHKGHNHGSIDPNRIGKIFFFAVALNVIFIITEVVFGFISNSNALIADATHNFSDVIGLLLSWGALILAKKLPTQKFSYGFKPASILTVILSTSLLFVAVGGIVWNSIHNIGKVVEVQSLTVITVALIGILINGLSAFLLSKGNEDLNVKSAYLHMMGDAAISLGVVISGFVIFLTGWHIIDPLVSILIAVFIVISCWSILKEAISLSLFAVPKKVNSSKVRSFLEGLNGVNKIHDLHIWAYSTTEIALTVHLEVSKDMIDDKFTHKVAHDLKEKFNINHSTIQIETGIGEECELQSDDIV
jgi:cobalt-zinc-cadmium efflux system protein